MKIIKYSPVILLCLFVNYYARSQNKVFPDSLKSIVIKIEPLSLIFDHITAGVELPTGKNFLDLSIGISNVGLTTNIYGTGGICSKVGIKFPLQFQSPYNLLYIMPEFATSNYNLEGYYYSPSGKEITKVNAYALMACFGFRHFTPHSNFYYDVGIDLGYGWASPGLSNYQYNFVILGDYYDDQYYSKSTFSGIALSCHAAVGIMLRKGNRK